MVGPMSGGLVSSEVLLGRSYVVTPLSIKYFPDMALLPDTWPQMSTFTSHCALGGFRVVVGVYLANIGCFMAKADRCWLLLWLRTHYINGYFQIFVYDVQHLK